MMMIIIKIMMIIIVINFINCCRYLDLKEGGTTIKFNHKFLLLIWFQKLMPGKDCKNSVANRFERKIKEFESVGPAGWTPFQFISQKPGLPNDAKFLAVNWNHPNGSDPLFLTNENNTQNRFVCDVWLGISLYLQYSIPDCKRMEPSDIHISDK